MTQRTTNLIVLGMLAGVVLGALLGYVWPAGMLATAVVGELFINALKILILPLIVASMIVGVTSLGDIRRVGRTGLLVLGYFLATTTVAVMLGLILVWIIRPGDGVLAGGMAAAATPPATGGGIRDIILSFIPDNIVAAMVEGRYLGVIIFSLVVGGVLSTLGPRARTMVNFFRELNQVVMKIVYLLLYAAPVGLLSIVGTIVARNTDSLGELGQGLAWYALTLLIGLVIHAVVVLPLALKFLARRSPAGYAGKMMPAFATAVGTSSSSATLPVTYECVVDGNKVDSRAASFVLPLGTTINMDGTAMYVVIATLFVAQVFGISLGLMQTVMVALTAILVSVGAAGIPSAALFMLGIVFGVAGFPAEAYAGIGLILAVDWLLDRGRTVVNIWGDAVGAAVIAATGVSRGGRPVRRTRSEGTSRSRARTPRRETGSRREEGSDQRPRNGRRSSGGGRGGQRDRTRRRTAPQPSARPTRERTRRPEPAAATPFRIAPADTPVLEVAGAGGDDTDKESDQRPVAEAGQTAAGSRAAPNDRPSDRRRNGGRSRGRTPGKDRTATRPVTPAAEREAVPAPTPEPPAPAREPAPETPSPPEQTVAPSLSAPPPVPETGKTSETPAAEPEAVTAFGRTRHRKGLRHPAEKPPIPEPEHALEPIDHFDASTLTFGRTRRKGGRL